MAQLTAGLPFFMGLCLSISVYYSKNTVYCSSFFYNEQYTHHNKTSHKTASLAILLCDITHKLIMLIALLPLKIQLWACDFTADAAVCDKRSTGNTENGLKPFNYESVKVAST